MIRAWSWHRLAKELLHLAEELREDTRAETRFAWTLTREDLANLIGTARETFTIQLRKFEDLGLIRRSSPASRGGISPRGSGESENDPPPPASYASEEP